MKQYGSRQLDELGRIVLPRELREELDVKPRDMLDIFKSKEGQIVLSAAAEHCKLCGSTSGLSKVENNVLCSTCIEQIKQM